MNTDRNAEQYVLIIIGERLAYGPYASRDDAEYAAMAHYGTAITGASARDAFLIAELRGGGDAAEPEHARHVEALLQYDD